MKVKPLIAGSLVAGVLGITAAGFGAAVAGAPSTRGVPAVGRLSVRGELAMSHCERSVSVPGPTSRFLQVRFTLAAPTPS
jgi:hypothetical protein